MKAVILAGGQGMRLLPLTCNIPKPMLPVLNQPFLEHMIRYLKGHGVDEVILTLCYLPDKIQEYFGDGASRGLSIKYTVEGSPLGTAGAVKNVEEALGESFLVFNGDVFTFLDLKALTDFHRKKKAKATIALTHVENPGAFGVVETDASGQVRRFTEKPGENAGKGSWINAGIYVLEPEVLGLVPPREFHMFENGLFPKLLARGWPMYAYLSEEYWIDMGTPTSYLKLHRDLLDQNTHTDLRGREVRRRFWLDEGSDIHPSATIEGPVMIGRDCQVREGAVIKGHAVLGDGCIVGPGASIQESVLWNGVKVGSRCNLVGCIIGQGAQIGEEVFIEESCVVGDEAVVERGNHLDRGMALWPGKRLEADSIKFLAPR